jgi:glycosyltransferase involved in cell wall biosynthesis
LNVWTTNIQKTNIIEKGLTTLLLEYFYFSAIKKFANYKNIDLVLYSTPPITFTNLIKRIKKVSSAKTYLLLKDIFPQNAVDLKLLNKNGFLYKYFRKQERVLYRISDYIGCMSPANVDYILQHNPEIEKNKIEVNPNSIEVKEDFINFDTDLYNKYNIPRDKVIFIFGGNLGMPQGIEYLKNNILFCNSIKEAHFLIVGDGTEYNNIEKWIQNEGINNALLIKELPKYEYDQIIKLSHIGLIFLNPQFTIPNFPSRILSYMQSKLPIICATDLSTDIGIIVSQNNFGFNCLTSDCTKFYEIVQKMINKDLREDMGLNGYEYLKNTYAVKDSYRRIIEKI